MPYNGILGGRIVPSYLPSRFGMIDHLWHNCQAANLCKQADVGTSSIVQPAPAIEENEDCLWLAGAAPA